MKETDKKKLVKLLAVGGAGVVAYAVMAPSGGAMFSGSGAGGLGLPSTGDGGAGAEGSGGAAVFNIPAMPAFEGFGDAEESVTDVLPSPASMADPVLKKDEPFVFGGASSIRSSSPKASFGGSWDEPAKDYSGAPTRVRPAVGLGTASVVSDAAKGFWDFTVGLRGGDVVEKVVTPKKVTTQATKDSFKSFATGEYFKAGISKSSGGIPSEYLRNEYIKKRAKGASKRAADNAADRASGTGAWSGFSRMTGENKVAGWKQVGAKKPTRAGQPDRY